MMRNKSTIDQIPHPPHVKSLPTPRPICPNKKRSIPRVPPRSEITTTLWILEAGLSKALKVVAQEVLQDVDGCTELVLLGNTWR